MKGYIQYTDASILSPSYPRQIRIGTKIYSSLDDAVLDGNDINNVILLIVRDNKELYLPYIDYQFSGKYSDKLNTSINQLLVSKREQDDIGRYVYILPDYLHKKMISISQGYSISVTRSVYLLEMITNEIYMQKDILDITDVYYKSFIGNMYIYTGESGSFILLPDKDTNVTEVINFIEQL